MNAHQTAQGANADDAVDPIAAAPQPSKKETSLREFLGKMDDYAPIVCPSHRSFTLFSLSVSSRPIIWSSELLQSPCELGARWPMRPDKQSL